MKEAIGGTWLFQIVIAFILLFTGYICLSINHTKAYNVKNNIVESIERAEGIDLSVDANSGEETIKKISNYLKEASYRTTGNCPDNYQPYNRDGIKDEHNAAFCINEVETGSGDFPSMKYYRVIVFYQLDLPLFNQVFNFKVTGDTKKINSSYQENGFYRIGPDSMCQEYKNGKKTSRPMVKCNTLPKEQIKGGM